jgi:hypothetical protein
MIRKLIFAGLTLLVSSLASYALLKLLHVDSSSLGGACPSGDCSTNPWAVGLTVFCAATFLLGAVCIFMAALVRLGYMFKTPKS